MTNLGTKESRKHLRVDAKVTVSYMGPTKNLSAGGMCVVVENPLAVGSEAQLDFTLPDSGTPISCIGRVVWADRARSKCELGLVFLDLPDEARARIEEFVQQYGT
jgi:Tfp pilus assembly protein PilZ